MYSHRSSTGPVDLAFTDRYDGVSAAPFDSLNLALVGEDDEVDRRRNLALVLDDFAPGARVADMEQVHGRRVVTTAGDEPRERCDALVTDQPDVVLVVRVADCVPVLLADTGAGVVGAAHAGRQGLAEGVVDACVEQMRALGATDVRAWIGPHVCGRCYEVPARLRDEVAALEPAAAATTSWGTPGLDLGAGVRARLERAGVTVDDVSRCTLESPDLYSYRRDGVRSGRLAGLVRRRS
ncbi:laccase [Marmoricola sp. Leaf446]|uniref:peptidoglycan editing factor PgeF n=1 Tax=Marmoricola sp. Leaf446 TaxID=1736379 RepID=UPI0006F59241|nr:peptidoglycan editing factor PgeF [Marmoricola sp. Leaf446]KQT91168.1 laccase [Marmoricola sp. Leaf446]